MPRVPKPWWRKDRKAWFVTINGKRHNLGADREAAFRTYHEMMAKPPATAAVDSVYAIVDHFLNWTKNNRADGTYRFYREKLQQFVDAVPADRGLGMWPPATRDSSCRSSTRRHYA